MDKHCRPQDLWQWWRLEPGMKGHSRGSPRASDSMYSSTRSIPLLSDIAARPGICKASSLASASCHAANSVLSCQVASSRQLANRARPGGGPRSKSQILAPDHSSCECRSSSFWNFIASSPTTSTWKVSLAERPSTDTVMKDTTT
jgi:hypothetical protein